MLRSVRETQKLFRIESVNGGRIDIKTSEHLLSFPQNKQFEVLAGQLENLKKDLAQYENPAFNSPNRKNVEINQTQLKLLIQVIESLLTQI